MRIPVVTYCIVAYSWDWGVEGEAESRNMYIIDTDSMTHMNACTKVERDHRIVWVQNWSST